MITGRSARHDQGMGTKEETPNPPAWLGLGSKPPILLAKKGVAKKGRVSGLLSQEGGLAQRISFPPVSPLFCHLFFCHPPWSALFRARSAKPPPPIPQSLNPPQAGRPQSLPAGGGAPRHNGTDHRGGHFRLLAEKQPPEFSHGFKAYRDSRQPIPVRFESVGNSGNPPPH